MSNKYPNYVSTSKGYPFYRALVCQHVVRKPDTKRCCKCHKEYILNEKPNRTAYSNYNETNRERIYTALLCGHPVSNPASKRCRECYDEWRKKEQRQRVGFSHINLLGYVVVWQNGKKRLEHDIIAEKVLGRRLKIGEGVHHINMNPSDNRYLNLLICDVSFHSFLHHVIARKYNLKYSTRNVK